MIAAAIAAAFSLSLVCGLINGLLISYLCVPAILATLGTMTFYSGIGMAITEGKGVVGFPDAFLSIGAGKIGEIPFPLICFLVAACAVSLALNRTEFGKSIYLFGANPIASLFLGIRNHRVTLTAYMISGGLAGFSSILMISRVNSAKVGYGDTYLLQAILVAVLGARSMPGRWPRASMCRLEGVALQFNAVDGRSGRGSIVRLHPAARGRSWLYGGVQCREVLRSR